MSQEILNIDEHIAANPSPQFEVMNSHKVKFIENSFNEEHPYMDGNTLGLEDFCEINLHRFKDEKIFNLTFNNRLGFMRLKHGGITYINMVNMVGYSPDNIHVTLRHMCYTRKEDALVNENLKKVSEEAQDLFFLGEMVIKKDKTYLVEINNVEVEAVNLLSDLSFLEKKVE